MAPVVVGTSKEDMDAADAGAAFTHPEAALWRMLKECQYAVGAAVAGEILRDLQESRNISKSASGSELLAYY